jgi:hypothetical protein
MARCGYDPDDHEDRSGKEQRQTDVRFSDYRKVATDV